jgi:SAM-dependent methyltransferase
MSAAEHWEKIYSSKPPESLSWFQEHPARSLRQIEEHAASRYSDIIDAGGGASTLVDGLVSAGFHNLTVADISHSALEKSKNRLGAAAGGIRWIEGDILDIVFPEHSFDIWHDRAVFHFLSSDTERDAYAGRVSDSLKPEGILIIATFADDGPETCSGLGVTRYSPAKLSLALGFRFTLLCHEDDFHRTPSGALQHFIYCCFRKDGAPVYT